MVDHLEAALAQSHRNRVDLPVDALTEKDRESSKLLNCSDEPPFESSVNK